MNQQFHIQEDEALRAQRMSDEEASRVVALWAERQRSREEAASMPTVHAMAEGLDIPPEEVLRLLQEVRAREEQEQARQAREAALAQQTRRRRRARLSAALVALAVGCLLALLLIRAMSARPVMFVPPVPVIQGMPVPQEIPAPPAGLMPHEFYSRSADGSISMKGKDWTYERRADGSISYKGPQGSYERTADGGETFQGPKGRYVRRADGSEELVGTPPSITLPDLGTMAPPAR